ncbi:MAG: hypothetical protein KGI33_09940 [Thaumarchaeota archaeon]|nr:hypothetical protein [Nitrososphaerota archaeon]
MTEEGRQVTMSEREIKTIVEVLKFAEGSCPIQDVTHEFKIDEDMIGGLISKLAALGQGE